MPPLTVLLLPPGGQSRDYPGIMPIGLLIHQIPVCSKEYEISLGGEVGSLWLPGRQDGRNRNWLSSCLG